MSVRVQESESANQGQAWLSVVVKEVDKSQAPGERRTDPRHGCNLPSCCGAVIGNRQADWAAQITNVSVSGLALLSERRFEKGTFLFIEPTGEDLNPASLWARVTRVEPDGAGRWIVGCRLLYRLGEDDLKDLLRTWHVSEQDS